MTTPTQQTADYPGSTPDDPERPRVALVGRSGGPATDDLYRLLRRRLLAITTILSVWYLLTAVKFAVGLATASPEELERLGGRGAVAVALTRVLVFTACVVGPAVLLWRRPPRTVFGLRCLELAVFGVQFANSLTLVVRPELYDTLSRPPAESAEARDAFVGQYIHFQQILWFFFIAMYGALVPNTLRRALLVTGVAAVSPLVVFAAYAFWLRPLPPDVALNVLSAVAVFQALAVAITAFSSSRVEHYRRTAADARRLGQYRLVERLGAGGMGEVFRAEHALLRRPCALKTIRPERAGDPAALRRFEREVQTTATLTHPNTVQIYDYGHAADGTFYYVMEYLPGLTLEEVVHRHGPLPPGRVVHLLRQVCGALGEAHARGLTHRDVKPGNVMVCERGGVPDVIKVLDFGLVQVPKDEPDAGTRTRDGAVAGTPAYMSPEQAGGDGVVDPRSDLYSVGAVAYFLLTGRPPFAGRSAAKMLAAHLYELPAPLPADVPPVLAAVVLRCLAKAPADRYRDAAALDAALAAAAVPVWTADDAATWWARASPDRSTAPALATASWAGPDRVLSSGDS